MAEPRQVRAPSFGRFSLPPFLPLRRKGEGGQRAAAERPAPTSIPAFNLLGNGSEPPRRHRHAVLAGTAVGALVVVSAVGWAYAWASADLAETRASYDAARVELAALDVPTAPPAEKSHVRLLEERDLRKTALASALATRVAWDRVLRELSLVIPEDVWLTSISANPQAGSTPDATGAGAGEAAPTLLVDGYTRSQRSVARVLARLSIVPAFRSVQLLGSTRTVVAKQEVFKFSLAATLKLPEQPA